MRGNGKEASHRRPETRVWATVGSDFGESFFTVLVWNWLWWWPTEMSADDGDEGSRQCGSSHNTTSGQSSVLLLKFRVWFKTGQSQSNYESKLVSVLDNFGQQSQTSQHVRLTGQRWSTGVKGSVRSVQVRDSAQHQI
ncbi:hypothetical protein Hanom_Chr11g01034781 [Helianthus anomalus]